MTNQLQSVLLDAPKEVDVPAIERELTSLWKHAGEDSSSTDAPVIRACSLNLVVYVEGTERALGLEEILGQVSVDHPSRIFFVSADRGVSSPSVDAWGLCQMFSSSSGRETSMLRRDQPCRQGIAHQQGSKHHHLAASS